MAIKSHVCSSISDRSSLSECINKTSGNGYLNPTLSSDKSPPLIPIKISLETPLASAKKSRIRSSSRSTNLSKEFSEGDIKSLGFDQSSPLSSIKRPLGPPISSAQKSATSSKSRNLAARFSSEGKSRSFVNVNKSPHLSPIKWPFGPPPLSSTQKSATSSRSRNLSAGFNSESKRKSLIKDNRSPLINPMKKLFSPRITSNQSSTDYSAPRTRMSRFDRKLCHFCAANKAVETSIQRGKQLRRKTCLEGSTSASDNGNRAPDSPKFFQDLQKVRRASVKSV